MRARTASWATVVWLGALSPVVVAAQATTPNVRPMTTAEKEALLRERIAGSLEALSVRLESEAAIGTSFVAQVQSAPRAQIPKVIEQARTQQAGMAKLIEPSLFEATASASNAEASRRVASEDITGKVTELRKYAQHLRNLRSSSAKAPIDEVLHALETEFVPDNVAIVLGPAGPSPTPPGGATQPFGAPAVAPGLGEDLLPFVVGLGATTVDFPAVAAILYIDPTSGGLTVKCTGTLVAPHVVLTAQHCLDVGEPQSVFFQHAGSYAVGTDALRFTPYSFPVGDVALIYLSQPVLGIEPVELNESAALAAASRGSIVGYGYHSPLQQPNGVPSLSPIVRKTGIKLFAQVTTSACEGELADKKLVCWTYPTTQLEPLQGSTCHGDSGGPLFVRGDKWRIAGVTSGGSSCLPGDHAVDTEVFAYKKWIKDGIEAQAVPASAANAQLRALHPVANAPERFPVAISNRILDSSGTWSKTFSIVADIRALRLAINATPSGTTLRLAVSSPDANVQCDRREDGTTSHCEFRNPPKGTWDVAVTGAPFQEFQVVATAF